MIILRRNSERRYIQSEKCEMWLTFYPREPVYPFDEGFGTITIFNEVRLPTNGFVVSSLESDTELITYVNKGSLALEGPVGRSGVITAGEFQCITIGRMTNHKVTNTSQTDLAHFFRIYLRLLPSKFKVDFIEAQTRYTVAQRRNALYTVASPQARLECLQIHTDAHIYSSILEKGHHITHEILSGRKCWLHIVYGSIQVNEVDLTSGDGLGIVDEHSISLTARENTELLLVDIASDTRRNKHTKKKIISGKWPGSNHNDINGYSL